MPPTLARTTQINAPMLKQPPSPRSPLFSLTLSRVSCAVRQSFFFTTHLLFNTCRTPSWTPGREGVCPSIGKVEIKTGYISVILRRAHALAHTRLSLSLCWFVSFSFYIYLSFSSWMPTCPTVCLPAYLSLTLTLTFTLFLSFFPSFDSPVLHLFHFCLCLQSPSVSYVHWLQNAIFHTMQPQYQTKRAKIR